MKENSFQNIQGFIEIIDDTGNIIVSKRNAIHYENMSEALALSAANKTRGFIHDLAFGNGGTSVDPTGVITYLPSNNSGISAALYNQTYFKTVDDNSVFNSDPTRNRIVVTHQSGTVYTDIVVRCLLDFGEPAGQEAFDSAGNFDDAYTFDEAGLKSWGGEENTGKLLTHVVFHPIQKSLNRTIQINYTIRIQTLSNLI